MTRADVVDQMARAAGIPRAQAERALAGFEQAVTQGLCAGERVILPGFGTFTLAQRGPRPGLNPRTHEPLELPATSTVRFTAGRGLREAVKP